MNGTNGEKAFLNVSKSFLGGFDMIVELSSFVML